MWGFARWETEAEGEEGKAPRRYSSRPSLLIFEPPDLPRPSPTFPDLPRPSPTFPDLCLLPRTVPQGLTDAEHAECTRRFQSLLEAHARLRRKHSS